MEPIVYDSIDSNRVLKLLERTPNIKAYKIQIDPALHQKPGKWFVPVSKDIIKTIVANVHQSARYRVKISHYSMGTEFQIGSVE